MRTTTFLWGLIVAIAATVAILLGMGKTLTLTGLAIALLLLFAGGFAVAAIMQKKPEPVTESHPEDLPAY